MVKKLFSNIPLKLMSVVVAIVVWLAVVNIDDPIVQRSISNVPVTVTNESYVESAGLMCLVEESQNLINVQVKGKRSVVDNLRPEDITATADLTQIADMNTTPVMVPISLFCPGITRGNLTSDPLNLRITLDDMMTQEFLISASAGESTPMKGYEIGAMTVEPEKIQITGPQSLIQKIDRVIANVEFQDLATDSTLEASLGIIDKNQDQLSEAQMDYLKYNSATPKVSVDVDLWRVKNDIELKPDYIGTPKAGYKVENITLTPNVISLAGTEDVLSQLAQEGNAIQIPPDYIDVSGKSKEFEVKIGLNDLLPEDTRLTTGSTDTAIATVNILPLNSKQYVIPTTSIQALNVEKDLRVVYETDSIQVRVREAGKSLSQLQQRDIKASIDLSGRTPGRYRMPVTITVPDGYEVMESVTTAVTIADDAEQESAGEEDADGQ